MASSTGLHEGFREERATSRRVYTHVLGIAVFMYQDLPKLSALPHQHQHQSTHQLSRVPTRPVRIPSEPYERARIRIDCPVSRTKQARPSSIETSRTLLRCFSTSWRSKRREYAWYMQVPTAIGKKYVWTWRAINDCWWRGCRCWYRKQQYH